MTWGQFIRWADPQVEENHYHLHTGTWPSPAGQEWLQWTASPRTSSIWTATAETRSSGSQRRDEHPRRDPGLRDHGARRGARGRQPLGHAQDGLGDPAPRRRPHFGSRWYPPNGVPAPVTVNIQGDSRPEIVVSLNDGFMHAFSAGGSEIWRFNYTHGKPVMYASEATVADLNQDGSPEIIFTTYGAPDETDSGYLVILARTAGSCTTSPAQPGLQRNGSGAPAAPRCTTSTATAGSRSSSRPSTTAWMSSPCPVLAGNCMPWPTARGGPLRMGQPNSNDL